MNSTAVTTAPRRRHRQRRVRWAAVLVVFSLVAVATSTSSWAKSPSAASGNNASGVLKVAAGLSPLGPLHFDPATSVVNADLVWEEMIFGTLLRWNAKGGLDPWMVESYKVVDPQTVTMTPRKGLTFTDGTPFDAEAIRTGLLHTLERGQRPVDGLAPCGVQVPGRRRGGQPHAGDDEAEHAGSLRLPRVDGPP